MYRPTPDAWMTLIFTEAHNVCNADQNDLQEADDGVYEMIFCDSCENDLDDIGHSDVGVHTPDYTSKFAVF